MPSALAQQPATTESDNYVRAHYTKYEYRIPMRDGKRLFTAVYVPKDTADGPYPFLMDRTPYNVGPYGEDRFPQHLGPSDEFQKAGYIFVYQDVRGRWMSEGEFQEMRPHIDNKKSPQDVDDASDTYDTIEFLLKHVPGNNGKVGIWGISYPGFYTSASHHRFASRAGGRQPAGAHDGSLHGRRRLPRRRLYAFRELRVLLCFQAADRAANAQPDRPRRLRLQRQLQVLFECRKHREPRQAVSEGLELAVHRPDEAQHLRRVLAGPRPVATHEECEVRRAGGGRVV